MRGWAYAALALLAALGPSSAVRALSRRALLRAAAVGGIFAAPAASLGDSPAAGAMASVRAGERSFRAGDVVGAVDAFDAALAAEPRLAPYLWQRGIALYYAGSFGEAAAQFQRDVAVNPADVEEALWHMVSRARVDGLAEARAHLLVVGRDRRPVLRDVYALFAASGAEAAMARARVERYAGDDASPSDAFYARLYLGLLAEAGADEPAARRSILAALQTPYAASSSDFMVDVARVHAARRHWS
ncbi:hypothetical protein KFE25_010391 [Diacronema lutheri]|uniref:Tetratricopeptide repeat protein n=2 Tax=Diacronema lutheri TaxID=2081491 RepID=A0A8J5X738_DIALT|nr:hypothetical protein KFE25_010391 [Diacronema lutheri]